MERAMQAFEEDADQAKRYIEAEWRSEHWGHDPERPPGWEGHAPDGNVKNVLVAYASRSGSTAEIAEEIAGKLGEFGLDVDCVPTDEVESLDPYDAVVLGSAVYIRHWHREARKFLRRHGEGLSTRPFWVFSSGPVGEPGGAADPVWVEPTRIVARVEELGAREHVVFGGRLPTDPRNPLERSLVARTPNRYRDRRDWREIRAWASRIAGQLGARRPESVAR